MKKTTLLLLFTLCFLGLKAQTTYQLNYDTIRVGKTAGTSGIALYGDIYLKNTISGLLRLNSDRKFVTTTLTESDIPSLSISKVPGLQDSLNNLVHKTGEETVAGIKTFSDPLKIGTVFSSTILPYSLHVSTPDGNSPVMFERTFPRAGGLGRALTVRYTPTLGIPAPADGLGLIFETLNSAGVYKTYSSMEFPIISPTAGAIKGSVQWWLADGTDLEADGGSDHIPYLNLYAKLRDSTRVAFFGTPYQISEYPSLAIGTKDSVSIFIDDSTDYVGIRNLYPEVELDVAGRGKFTRSAFSMVDINSLTSDAILRLSHNNVKQWDLKNLSTDDSFNFFNALGSSVVSFNQAGNLTATSLIKSGGTSSQFLKADGSVDASTYLTTSTAAGTYQPLENQRLSTSDSPTFTALTLNATSGTVLNVNTVANNTDNLVLIRGDDGGNVGLNVKANGGVSVGAMGAGDVTFSVTGTGKFTDTLTLNYLSASQLVATDASKNLVSVTALPSGTTATTQTAGDNSTKVATTAYVDGLVSSGTYTASITGVSGYTTATPYISSYQKIGSQVFVSGYIHLDEVDPTAILKISLPIASNFTDIKDCRGGASQSIAAGNGYIQADTTGDMALLTIKNAGSEGASDVFFNFSYTIQ